MTWDTHSKSLSIVRSGYHYPLQYEPIVHHEIGESGACCLENSCWLFYFKGCEDFRFSCNGYGHSIMERNAGIFSANENSPWANYQRQKGWTGCRAAQSHVGFIRHVLHLSLLSKRISYLRGVIPFVQCKNRVVV